MTWQTVTLVLGIVYAFLILILVSGGRHGSDRSDEIRRSITESEKRFSGQTSPRDTRYSGGSE